LKIADENQFIDETYSRMHLDAHAGSYVVITVSDTGIGIPPEILEHIFEPFFTTKGVGQGTGLGLSTVLGIIKNYDGFVKVQSEAGKGTKFSVYLPVAEGTITEPIVEEELPQGHGELILLVDDEAVVQQTTKAALENYNYKTLIANDGIEAIALYVEYQQDISVVLIDIIMPNMDGLTTIRTLRAINPQVKIIGTSGLPTNHDRVLAAGAMAFLSKPYTSHELLNTLLSVITT
jgi:CheY-like chemotaxis protein